MRPVLLIAALLLVAGAGWLHATAEDDAETAITWHDDVEAARAKAKKEGRPLLVVFQ